MNHTTHIAEGLAAMLHMPSRAKGVVVLVDGSAGAREQGRHRIVAGYLERRQFATLVLHPHLEAALSPEVGDAEAIAELAHRLRQALDWLDTQLGLRDLPIGVFGSGRGAAAAIVCAAEQPGRLAAVVSRAGLLDRVPAEVARVRSPVLLVVGALDTRMLAVTRHAYRALETTRKQLEIVPRATHLFEEAGALERVAMAAGDWFEQQLRGARI